MARPRLTLDQAKSMDFSVLMEAAQALIAPYEAKDIETPDELQKRIGRTLDEAPDIYGWFLQLHAWFDHWTEFWANQGGTGKANTDYKDMRIKRDFFEDCARAIKLRYEGTSRRLTQIQEHDDESRMPRGRHG